MLANFVCEGEVLGTHVVMSEASGSYGQLCSYMAKL